MDELWVEVSIVLDGMCRPRIQLGQYVGFP